MFSSLFGFVQYWIIEDVFLFDKFFLKKKKATRLFQAGDLDTTVCAAGFPPLSFLTTVDGDYKTIADVASAKKVYIYI